MPSSARSTGSHRPPGQRQRKEKQFNATTTPTTWAPSGTGRQYRPRRRPKRARRSGKIGAGTDTPTPVARGGPLHRSAHKRLFLFHRARRILFLGKTKRGPRRAPRGGERRSKGAGAVFAAGGNGAERTLRRRNGGRIPRGNGPLREQNPPWPTSGGPSSPKAGDLLRSSSPRPAPADISSIL